MTLSAPTSESATGYFRNLITILEVREQLDSYEHLLSRLGCSLRIATKFPRTLDPNGCCNILVLDPIKGVFDQYLQKANGLVQGLLQAHFPRLSLTFWQKQDCFSYSLFGKKSGSIIFPTNEQRSHSRLVSFGYAPNSDDTSLDNKKSFFSSEFLETICYIDSQILPTGWEPCTYEATKCIFAWIKSKMSAESQTSAVLSSGSFSGVPTKNFSEIVVFSISFSSMKESAKIKETIEELISPLAACVRMFVRSNNLAGTK